MDKAVELRRMKARATGCLVLVTAGFLVLALIPQHNFWTAMLKAGCEAAMVGALADWFAVVALFRKPWPLSWIPGFTGHTAIIPRNKNRIADNLAEFIKDKFLDAESLVRLIKKHDPAQRIADWLVKPSNTEILAQYVSTIAKRILFVVDDRRIQRFFRRGIETLIDRIDLSLSVGAVLDTLTHDGRHQELMTQLIERLVAHLQRPETRQFIAEKIVAWLQREHAIVEKVLPSQLIGEKSADIISNIVENILNEITEDHNHEFRQYVDQQVQNLIERLKTDDEFRRRGEDIKNALRKNAALNAYIGGLLNHFRNWMEHDLDRPDSAIRANMRALGRWLGEALAQNQDLRQSFNDHLEDAAQTMSPDFAEFLTEHIRSTVRNWDARDTSRVLELNIGKDLQGIRINGTVVGGLIGVALYGISVLIGMIVRG